MRISAAVEYGFRGIVYLAMMYGRGWVDIKKICRDRDIKETYLIKIFKTISQDDLILSRKGYGGGFKLAKAPGEISVESVWVALAGRLRLDVQESSCLFGRQCQGRDDQNCCRTMVAKANRAMMDAF